jgi:hypothetical protein
MRSQAGRNGAAATNHRTSARRVERELKAALSAQDAATVALQPAEQALVAPLGAPVDISTPVACETVISNALGAVLSGQLPPSRSKAVVELLKVRIELASLSISQRLLQLEQNLKDQRGGAKPGRRNLPRRAR